MNPKLLLGLALVLSGGLFGCSTAPSGVLSKSAEGRLFSNQEAVCLKSDDPSRPWILKYALTEDTVNEGQLFVTVHSRGEVDSYDDLSKWRPESMAAIYVKAGDKFKLLKRLSTDETYGGAYFLKPNIIQATVTSSGGDSEQLIQITEVIYGTGHFTKEHIFAIHGTRVNGSKFTDFNLEEVEFIPASESYLFGKDEGLKWESDTLTDYNLSFTFFICNLSGKGFRAIAKVTGTYKLEQKPDGKLRIIMDKFKREPITDYGS